MLSERGRSVIMERCRVMCRQRGRQQRAFYLACGFRPLEEFPTLWGPENPALQLVKRPGL